MKPALSGALTVLALLLSVQAHAQIYSYVDESGQRVFTDRPPASAGAKTVKPSTINRMPAGQRFIKLQPPAELKEQLAPEPPPYQALTLLSPHADETLRNSGRSIAIQVNSEPQLRPGHRYQAWLDGQPYGKPSKTASWTLEEVDRGSHQLLVHLLDENGRSLLQTPAIILHMKQTSLAERRRIRPCEEDDYGKRPECPLADKPEKARPWWRPGL